MANILVQAAARSNSIYIAAADRIGIERGQKFIGQSLIVSYTGWPVAGPAGETGETLIVADLPVTAAKAARAWGEFNNVISDRRPDVYAKAAAPTPVASFGFCSSLALPLRYLGAAYVVGVGREPLSALRTWRRAATRAASAFRVLMAKRSSRARAGRWRGAAASPTSAGASG